MGRLKEKILGESKPKSKWDSLPSSVPYTGDESAEEALENELAHELGVAYDVYGRVNHICSFSLYNLERSFEGWIRVALTQSEPK